MLEDIITTWLVEAVKIVPVVAFMALALWDMRQHLKRCMASNEELLERLINEVLDKEDS